MTTSSNGDVKAEEIEDLLASIKSSLNRRKGNRTRKSESVTPVNHTASDREQVPASSMPAREDWRALRRYMLLV
ncbi:hypothetical protein [Pandoraea sputorum]|uniref:hypothetical protein n=1 Tax=Pandoraea sputorum TaxID=93222 RepID=UPI002AF6B114|nr:hypothetical protein [Pandoraea sputorum]